MSPEASSNLAVGRPLVMSSGRGTSLIRTVRVGTIATTCDPFPSSWLPFPQGFKHDLSLITGPDLPVIPSPPGFPMISGWAPYSAVLDGGPILVCRLNAVTVGWRALADRGTSAAAQEAIALGSEYLWDRNTRTQSASIIWRTIYDPDSAQGFSGSVLCLGQSTDKTAQAVVFQNYEGLLKP